MIIYINEALKMYLKQAIDAFGKMYHYLPKQLLKLKEKLRKNGQKEKN